MLSAERHGLKFRRWRKKWGDLNERVVKKGDGISFKIGKERGGGPRDKGASGYQRENEREGKGKWPGAKTVGLWATGGEKGKVKSLLEGIEIQRTRRQTTQRPKGNGLAPSRSKRWGGRGDKGWGYVASGLGTRLRSGSSLR